MKRRTFNAFPGDEQKSILAFLGDELAFSSDQVQALVAGGAVYRQGKRVHPTDHRPPKAGEVWTVVLEERGASTLVEAAPAPLIRVLYEDAELLAVDKPAGISSQPTAARVGNSLHDLLQAQQKISLKLVHRLDRETSGVMLFAKTKEGTTRLSDLFRRGEVSKTYFAVVGPAVPEQGAIDLPLSKDPSRPGRQRASKHANGVSALTEFRCQTRKKEWALVELWPKTGRTHQLRAHLTALGVPIAGDKLYGGPTKLGGLDVKRCLLHARKIEFGNRTGKILSIESPFPEDFLPFI